MSAEYTVRLPFFLLSPSVSLSLPVSVCLSVSLSLFSGNLDVLYKFINSMSLFQPISIFNIQQFLTILIFFKHDPDNPV